MSLDVQDAKARAYWHNLPQRPSGKSWNRKHVLAAYMRSRGHDWPDIADAMGVSANTARHYTSRCKDWHLLEGHFRRLEVARLESTLEQKALRRLEELLDDEDGQLVARAASESLRHIRGQRQIAIELLREQHKAEEGQDDLDRHGDVIIDAEIEPDPPQITAGDSDEGTDA